MGRRNRTNFGLCKLVESKVPGEDWSVATGGIVLHALDGVRPVRTAHIDFKSSQGHPNVLVNEEPRQDIKHGVLRIHNFLKNRQVRLPVVKPGLTVPRLHDR